MRILRSDFFKTIFVCCWLCCVIKYVPALVWWLVYRIGIKKFWMCDSRFSFVLRWPCAVGRTLKSRGNRLTDWNCSVNKKEIWKLPVESCNTINCASEATKCVLPQVVLSNPLASMTLLFLQKKMLYDQWLAIFDIYYWWETAFINEVFCD